VPVVDHWGSKSMNRASPLLLLLSLSLPACRTSGTTGDPAAAAPSAAATEPPQTSAPSPSAGPSSPSSPTPGFVWPVPEGWKQETIPFPLGFAPDLPYEGIEELRFAPAFFDPSAPTYFSYAFVWWLKGRPEFDRASLERDLVRYFAGLCNAVGKNKFSFDNSRFKAKLEPSAEPANVAFSPAQSFRGTLDAYDPFKNGNGRELSLNVDLAIGDCAASGHRVVLVAASPKPRADPIWQALAERKASFHCP